MLETTTRAGWPGVREAQRDLRRTKTCSGKSNARYGNLRLSLLLFSISHGHGGIVSVADCWKTEFFSVAEELTDRSLAIYCQGYRKEKIRPIGNGMNG
jgi:hypothetical protein